MKKTKLVLTLLVVFCASGCGNIATPLTGLLFTDVKGPIAVGPATTSPKVGRARATQILVFAAGDASIAKAMADGGITKVSTVDHESVSFLFGLFGRYTVVVRGE